MSRINVRFEIASKFYRLAQMTVQACQLKDMYTRGTTTERLRIINQLKKNFLFHRKMHQIFPGLSLPIELDVH